MLLPDMDPKTCVYLSLASFLEKWLQYGDGNLSQWLFCEGSTTNESPTADQDKEANRGKQAYARALKRVIDSPAFTKADDERLGSHSIQKAAATKAREKGTPKDDIDYRARWAAKRMQDAYVSAQLLWPDVNCASRLCFKGVCKYVMKEQAGVTDDWLIHHVTPRITGMFGKKVGAILAKPLLWAAFDPIWAETIEPTIRSRIISQFIRMDRNLGDNVNPVSKIEVIPNKGRHASRIEFVNAHDYTHTYNLTHSILDSLLLYHSGWYSES